MPHRNNHQRNLFLLIFKDKIRHLRIERVYLCLHKVGDTPLDISTLSMTKIVFNPFYNILNHCYLQLH